MSSYFVDIERDINEDMELIKTRINVLKNDIAATKQAMGRTPSEDSKKLLKQLEKELITTTDNLKRVEKAKEAIGVKLAEKLKRNTAKREELSVEETVSENELEVLTQKLEDLQRRRQSTHTINMRKQLEDKIKREKLNLQSIQATKAEVEFQGVRFVSKAKIVQDLTQGFGSFFRNTKLLYNDYLMEQRVIAEKYENNKAKMMGALLVNTFSRALNMFGMGLQVFFATSEEYFKDTVKTWGKAFKDALSPILKPLMFIVGAFSFVKSLLLGKKKEEGKDVKNPVWTKLFSGTYDTLKGIEAALVTSKELAQREEKKRARTTGTAEKEKSGFLGFLTGFLGIGALMTAISAAFSAMAPLILPIIAGLAALVAVSTFLYGFFNTEGDFFDKVKGGFMNMAEVLLKLPVMLYDWIMDAVFGQKPPEGGTMKAVMGYIEKYIDYAINIFKSIWNTATSLWDIVKGVWNVFDGVYETLAGIFTLDLDRFAKGLKTLFVDGLGNIIQGIYKGIAAVIDTIFAMFGVKSGVFDKVKAGFDYIFGLEWLKDIIKALPSMLVPDDLLTWANAKKDEKKTPDIVKKKDNTLPDAITDNSDTKKRAGEEEKKAYIQSQKDITDALQDISAQGGNATAIANGGGAQAPANNNSSSELKIPTRTAPELVGASFLATC